MKCRGTLPYDHENRSLVRIALMRKSRSCERMQLRDTPAQLFGDSDHVVQVRCARRLHAILGV